MTKSFTSSWKSSSTKVKVSDELSELNFETDLAEILQAEDSSRWKIAKGGALEIFIALSSAKDPENLFHARLLWIVYPGEAPSLKFRDPATGRLDIPETWPVVRGFRPNTLDACVNWCSEGFTIHPEWKNDPNIKWNSSGNVLLKVIRTLQTEMDEHYVKRFGK
jgi:hypothetical protein